MDKRSQVYVDSLDPRKFTNNTQRVLFQLLKAGNEGWVSRGSIRVPSATARIRDLRTASFGSFEVDCRSSQELRNVRGGTFYYRLSPRSVNVTRLRQVFVQ